MLGTIQKHSLRANPIEEVVRSKLAREADPAGPLRLIGELVVPDPERSRQAFSAFLSGFSGNPQPLSLPTISSRL
jgi:hypothetical protein